MFKSNPRIEILKNIVENIDANVVIWCKYIYSLNLVANSFDCVTINGNQNSKERNCSLHKFGNESNVLVATFGVGSHGLNLTQSNNVIFYENVFNYGHRVQAEDRCHRIGQEKDVLYTDIICSNSIDTYIERSILKKENLISSFNTKINSVRGI